MKVILEFDTKDLPAFHEPGSLPGAGFENVGQFLNKGLLCATLERHLRFLCSKEYDEDSPLYKAIVAAYEEERILAERMLAGLRFET